MRDKNSPTSVIKTGLDYFPSQVHCYDIIRRHTVPTSNINIFYTTITTSTTSTTTTFVTTINITTTSTINATTTTATTTTTMTHHLAQPSRSVRSDL